MALRDFRLKRLSPHLFKIMKENKMTTKQQTILRSPVAALNDVALSKEYHRQQTIKEFMLALAPVLYSEFLNKEEAFLDPDLLYDNAEYLAEGFLTNSDSAIAALKKEIKNGVL